MKPQWILLWSLLLSVGIGVRAEVDLDTILEDDNANAGDGVEAVADEGEADLANDEAEEVVEVSAPSPAAVPEPSVAAPAAAEPAATKDEGHSIGHRLAMWLPNRLVDLDDIVSFGLGVGAKAGIEPIVTRFQPFLGSYGDQYFIVKGYDRQWGGGYESGWSWGDLEKRYVEDTFGSVRPYIHNHGSLAEYMDLKNPFPQFDWEVYKENKRDLWAIGVDAGWLVSAKAYVHPVEIADFVTGIFLYDLRGDDF